MPDASPWGGLGQPRVFVEHSGYDLLNIGDMAMLKATVTRLQDRWPGARLQVVTTSRERLAALCPGTDPVIVMPDRGPIGLLPERVRGGISLRCKRAVSAYPRAAWRFSPGTSQLLDALRSCDLAVCSGGGFLNDSFLLHASGVLAGLRSVQRRGMITAMLGQGYGPVTSPPLAELAGKVIPQLTMISLRGPHGLQAVSDLRAGRDKPIVTGDDALELAGAGRLGAGAALGVNLRAAAYTGLQSELAGQIASVVAVAAAEAGMPMRGLPISWHYDGEDWRVLSGAFGADSAVARTGRSVRDISSLAAAVADCRMVVTSSYHAAVFALARGIPALGISATSYYDGKFGGLRELYGPQAVSVLAVNQGDWRNQMRRLVRAAAELNSADRAAIAARSAELADASRGVYEDLFKLVESSRTALDRPTLSPAAPPRPPSGHILRIAGQAIGSVVARTHATGSFRSPVPGPAGEQPRDPGYQAGRRPVAVAVRTERAFRSAPIVPVRGPRMRAPAGMRGSGLWFHNT